MNLSGCSEQIAPATSNYELMHFAGPQAHGMKRSVHTKPEIIHSGSGPDVLTSKLVAYSANTEARCWH
eukprot:1139475-Pelagomonas_calceolata.AAC.4